MICRRFLRGQVNGLLLLIRTKKVLLVSNVSNNLDSNLIFNDKILVPVSEQRHLGVTLSDECKWSSHIDLIYKSCMKEICVLRKLKYTCTLNRQTLLKIYKCFILPILEYASEVCDGCSKSDIQRLESLQLEAARIACVYQFIVKKSIFTMNQNWKP